MEIFSSLRLWHWALAEKSINHNPLWATVLRFAATRIPSIWFRWLLWRIKMILIIGAARNVRLENMHDIFYFRQTRRRPSVASRILHIFPSSSSSHHLSVMKTSTIIIRDHRRFIHSVVEKWESLESHYERDFSFGFFKADYETHPVRMKWEGECWVIWSGLFI